MQWALIGDIHAQRITAESMDPAHINWIGKKHK
jgi:hypothetical protein